MITSDNERDASPKQTQAESAFPEKSTVSDYDQWQDSFDYKAPPQSDNSLNLSRALALSAIVIVAAAFVFPGAFSILFFGWGILLLYCLHSFYQDRKVKDVLDKSSNGIFRSLPKSSMLWGVSIPLALAGAVSAILSSGHVQYAITTRWVALCFFAAVYCCSISSLMRGSMMKSKTVGLINGMSLGVGCAAFCLFSAIAVISEKFADYGLAIALSSLLVIYSGSLMKQLLLRTDRARSFAIFCAACVGTLATFALGLGPELRGLAIAFGEKFAVSKDRPISDLGYRLLSITNPARELKGSYVASGEDNETVATSLIHVKDRDDIEKMFFFLTGKSIAGNKNLTPSYAGSGSGSAAVLPGLSLVESKLTGHVDADALTAVTYWTLTFGNKHGAAQEAQAQIKLPPHSAITRATLWINGVPQEAAFNSTARVTQAYNWIVSYHRDPLLVTELSPGLVKIQAFPVPQYGEMKVRLGITYGLEPKSKRDFSFSAPKIVSSNFKMEDVDTSVKLEGNAPLSSNATGGAQAKSGANHVYLGTITPSTERGWQFVAHRSSDFNGYSARATHSSEDMVISERLVAPSNNLQKLAIVIDGSKTVGAQKEGIQKALSQISKQVKAKVFLADRRDQAEALEVKDAINRLGNLEFGGGVDNVQALKLAAKYLGRQENSAILWIHGEQPILFPEDGEPVSELMVRGEHRIKLYDVQLGSDAPNAIEGYMSSLSSNACPEIRSLAQSDSTQNDLTTFLSSAGANGVNFQIVREKIPNKHLASTSYDFAIASRLSSVWAADEARKCNSSGDVATAELLGNVYRVVTPATGAVVMEAESDYSHESLQRNFYSVVGKNARAKMSGIADGTSTLDRDDARPNPNASVSLAENARRALVPPPPAPVPLPAALVPNQSPNASDKSRDIYGEPALWGATNGTIGPQGDDATIVTGVQPQSGSFDWHNLKLANWSELACVFGGILMVFAGVYYLGRGFIIQSNKGEAINSLVSGSILLVLAQVLLHVMLQFKF